MNSAHLHEVDILEIAQKCVYCGYCSVCPTFKELNWESNHPRGILEQIKMYYNEKYTKDVSKSLFDAIFSCTMCKACENICIVDLPLLQVWEQIRQEAFRRGRWSSDLLTIYDKVKATHNIFGLPHNDRLDWAEMSGINLSRRIKKKAPVAFFIGCQASYSGKMAGIAESMVKILRKARVDFTILGDEEWCCGAPIFLGGGYTVGTSLAKHNCEELKKLGVKKIVSTCAGCYRSFKIVYPKILGDDWDIEVVHASELIDDLVDKKKIKLLNTIDEKITYKDPCELVRHCGLSEAPRSILKKLPDVRYEELPSNKEEALCCGGGGLLKINNPKLVSEVNTKLISEIEYTEADVVVSCCPLCVDTIQQGVKEKKLGIKVLDLVELVKMSMEVKK